jgi:hypothetical protein
VLEIGKEKTERKNKKTNWSERIGKKKGGHQGKLRERQQGGTARGKGGKLDFTNDGPGKRGM